MKITIECLNGHIARALRGCERRIVHLAEDHLFEYVDICSECDLVPKPTSHNKVAFADCKYRPDITWVLPDLTVMLEID